MKKICLILMAVSLLLLAACGEPQIRSGGKSVTSIEDTVPDDLIEGFPELVISILGNEVKEAWLGAITGDGIAPDMGSILRLVIKGKQSLSLEDLKSGILEILDSGSYETVDLEPSAETEDGKLKALGEMAGEVWSELTEVVDIPGLDKLIKKFSS